MHFDLLKLKTSVISCYSHVLEGVTICCRSIYDFTMKHDNSSTCFHVALKIYRQLNSWQTASAPA